MQCLVTEYSTWNMDSIFKQIAEQVIFCFQISKSFTCIFNVLVIYFVTSIFSLSQNMTLNCGTNKFITSPGYPSPYPNDALAVWIITAPSHRRILITFYDFNLEDTVDNLDITDSLLDTLTRYKGGNILYPPFLSQGYQLIVKFTSSDRGRRRGFNISVSCDEPSGEFSGRLMDGTSPLEGFFELRSESGEWKRVCEENLSPVVANMICAELGSPGVEETSYIDDACLVEEKCTRGPECQDKTYRLEDCVQGNDSICTSTKSVSVRCKEVGYKGCYDLGSQQTNGFSFKSKEHCISSCRKDDVGAIAAMNPSECFCSTSDEIALEDLMPLSDDCASISAPSSKMKIYSAYVGFCEELNNTVGGSWDSDISWFGSTVNLTCNDGYRLEGNGTIRCIPGSSPYYPIWNDSIPSCVMEGYTPRSDDGVKEDNAGSITTIIPVVVAIVVVILLVIGSYWIWKKKAYRWKGGFRQSPMGTWDERRSSDPRSRGESGDATDSRRTDCPATGVAGRRPTQVLPAPPQVPSSRHSNALRLLHQINPPQQNHYMSPNNEQNPYYYATSTDNQRGDSTRLQEPGVMNVANRTYESTVDEEQTANLGNASVAYYATSPVSPNVASTLATSPEEIYHEPSIVNLNDDAPDSKDRHQRSDHTYEGAGDQVTPNTMLGNIVKAGLSMISRPLPHRPSSVNCKEGPSLPPRKASRGSQREATASLRKRKPGIVNENNNSILGACSLDCSRQQNIPRDDINQHKQKRLPETPLYYTLEKEEHRNRVHRQDNLDTPKNLKKINLIHFIIAWRIITMIVAQTLELFSIMFQLAQKHRIVLT